MSLVSIILPTYKDAPFLARAITSVCSQRYADWELVIVDDGLSESAKRLIADIKAKDTRIIVIENERNLGVQRSLNRGIAAARGEFVARIDDDDEWIDPRKLDKQIAFFKENPEYVLVGTNAVICDEKGKELGTYSLPETDKAIRRKILSKNCFLHPTIMARKNAIEKAGGYSEREEAKHIEDYDLWLRLGTLGKFANLHEMLVRLMVHENSMTAQNRIVQARRMRNMICQFRREYPCFLFGYTLLTIRYLGFLFISIIPIPKKMLYGIQNIYKKI